MTDTQGTRNQQHRWSMLTAQGDPDRPVLAAVCAACGLIRTSALPRVTMERHIALGGDCPGEPQPQEPTGGAVERSA